MNYKEQKIYELLHGRAEMSKEVEEKVKIGFICSHFPGLVNKPFKTIKKFSNALYLNDREYKKALSVVYKGINTTEKIVKKTCFLISDRKQILYYGTMFQCLCEFISIWVANALGIRNDFFIQKLYLCKGCFAAAKILETDVDKFVDQVMRRVYEKDKCDEDRTTN